jgi:hypothetical protein
MKTKTPLALVLASLALFGGACQSTSTPDGSASTAQRASATSDHDLAGTWAFVLGASDVASAVSAGCSARAAGDTDKAATCVAEAREEAAREKIRFTTSAGRTVFTSFADEEGGEVLFLEVPVELTADGAGAYLAKIAGPAAGPQAESLRRDPVEAMRIEIVDARTIVPSDPKKGRLVYGRP